MRFMAIVKADANSEAEKAMDPKVMAAIGEYNDRLEKAGVLLGGEGLRASVHGARVSSTGVGKVTVTDGPFPEAKELVGGFWLLKTASKAEAVDWAKRAPIVDGEIEVRQVFETEDFPVDPSEQPDGWRERELKMRDQGPPPAPASADGTRRYMVMVKADKASEAGTMPSTKLLEEMGALMEETVKRGALLGGDGLAPSAKGARVRFSAGKSSVIDGPFTEAKELVAGWAILRAKSKEEAVDWAKRMLAIHMSGSGAPYGQIEVRSLFEEADFAG